MIPGGESTVMGKLIRDMGMAGPLRAKIEGGACLCWAPVRG